MTCVLGWMDKSGAYLVSDRRIITDGGTLTSDRQSKVWTSEDQSITVGYAGSVGTAQIWIRKLAEGVDLLTSLPCEENPSFCFVAYDATTHHMFHGDSSGFLILKHDLLAIGSGGPFALGYVAGSGKKVTPDLAKKAIRACSKVDLSVSAGSDLTYIKRHRRGVSS